jgi:hypothetical protein
VPTASELAAIWDRPAPADTPTVLPPLPPLLVPLPSGAVGSGTLDTPCGCGSMEVNIRRRGGVVAAGLSAHGDMGLSFGMDTEYARSNGAMSTCVRRCRGEPRCWPNFANPSSEFPIGSKARRMQDCPEVYRRLSHTLRNTNSATFAG